MVIEAGIYRCTCMCLLPFKAWALAVCHKTLHDCIHASWLPFQICVMVEFLLQVRALMYVVTLTNEIMKVIS